MKTIMIHAFFVVTLFHLIISKNIASNKTSEIDISEKFAVDLYNHIAGDKSTENVIISPFSVQTCIAMTFFGATGQTATEMVSGLHLISSDKEQVARKFEKLLNSAKESSKVSIANKLYASKNYAIKPEFTEIVEKAFHAGAENIDFSKEAETVKTINKWVESKTNNKIKDLLNNVDSSTSMILVNAIHFKADWEIPFSDYSTYNAKFWLSDKDTVSVPTMRDEDQYKYVESELLDAKVMELQYKNSNFSMVLILPNKRNGLKEMIPKISKIDLIKLSNEMNFIEVALELPKFKIEFGGSLNDILQSMGMKKMFSDSAEFSGIFTNDVPVKISDVVHKAFIEVNEAGTEAAAATYSKIVPLSGISDLKFFKADHPFVYLIKDKTSIYFIGHVAKF